MPASIYGYYINLDERGEFYADVRDGAGNTVWEVHTQDAAALVEDGFINDMRDAGAVGQHLASVGVLPKGATVLASRDLEARQAAAERDSGLGS